MGYHLSVIFGEDELSLFCGYLNLLLTIHPSMKSSALQMMTVNYEKILAERTHFFQWILFRCEGA